MSRWPFTSRRPRISGIPPSANGASSLHLRWDLHGMCRAVSVDLTVLDTPAVARLYFWALQADFATSRGATAGGAHLGLQWHPGHPGSSAVNWGGYNPNGRELGGSESSLPSAMGNANTRDHPWRPAHTYRLEITRVATRDVATSPAKMTPWRGSVTDLATGTCTVVRDLYVPGDRISAAMVWSEVFARCEDPPVTVRWSDPIAMELDGEPLRPLRATVNYQSHADGGCANTCSWSGSDGLYQRTNTERSTLQGTVLPWT